MQPPSRIIGVWILVMGAAVLALRAADRLPALIAGTPHRARVFATVEQAERALGWRIWLPGYYPEELQWPPFRVEASGTSPVTAILRIGGRDDGRERLVIAQSLGGASAPPRDELPPGRVLGTPTAVRVGAHPAQLARVLVGPRELHDLWWDQDRRRITLRYAGPVQQLLLIAGSLERQAADQ
jgi:hypothetical protein